MIVCYYFEVAVFNNLSLITYLIIIIFREPQWSIDESVCVHNVNNDVACYAAAQFDKPAYRIQGQKVASVSLSQGNAPFHLLCYVPGI